MDGYCPRCCDHGRQHANNVTRKRYRFLEVTSRSNRKIEPLFDRYTSHTEIREHPQRCSSCGANNWIAYKAHRRDERYDDDQGSTRTGLGRRAASTVTAYAVGAAATGGAFLLFKGSFADGSPPTSCWTGRTDRFPLSGSRILACIC